MDDQDSIPEGEKKVKKEKKKIKMNCNKFKETDISNTEYQRKDEAVKVNICVVLQLLQPCDRIDVMTSFFFI